MSRPATNRLKVNRTFHPNGYVPLARVGPNGAWNADVCACGQPKDRRAKQCRACYEKPPTKKRCNGCSRELSVNEFYRRSSGGYLPRCKSCVAAEGRTRCPSARRRYQQKSRSRPGYYKAVAERLMHRRATDPVHKLADNLRRNLRQCIHRRSGRKTAPTLQLLGCSVEEFKKYIEARWRPGMSWDNWGRRRTDWQLDHIRPVASFDLQDPKQVAKCFHFTNYQPLWHIENASKGARWQSDRSIAFRRH